MQTAAKLVLGIVPAGIALGALLGAAVDPDMKDAPAPWWRPTGSNVFASAEPGPESWPQDFAAARGHRPDLDYDAEVWALPIPVDEFMALADEQIVPPPDPAGHEEAADEAEAAVDDALAAVPAQPEPAPAPGEVRKAELTAAGLY
jgi:hypothetical protein